MSDATLRSLAAIREHFWNGFVAYVGQGYNARGSFPTRLTELSDDLKEFAATLSEPAAHDR